MASLWRTAVPYAVAWLLVGTTRLGIAIDNGVVEQFVIGVLSVAVAGGYYAAARVLEVFRARGFGWLLGAPQAPAYIPAGVGLPAVALVPQRDAAAAVTTPAPPTVAG